GGEAMGRAGLVFGKAEGGLPRGKQSVYDTHLGWRFPNPKMEAMFPLESMGETGENVAERYGVSREEQDEFALQSHRRWAAAADAGRFDEQIGAVGEGGRGEHPRPATPLEKRGTLRPAFPEGGTGPARHAAGINAGRRALAV